MKKICPKNFKSGFTLIELLVTISIMGILFSVGIAAYNQFNRKQIVVQAAKTFKNDLRLAQSKALAGEKPTGCTNSLNGYQVSFSSDSYSLSAICSASVLVKTVPLPQNVTFSSVPSSILFRVLAQGTNLSANQTMTLTGFDVTQIQTVTVTPSGEIN